MGALHDYAKEELERIGYFKENEDPYDTAVSNAILQLIDIFSEQGHSGFTAPYTIRTFARLAMYKPLSPLTGEDDEWEEVVDGLYQNNRCFTVFKKDGQAYNTEGRIFSKDGGETWFTNGDSRVDIEFPYVVPDHPEKVILKEDTNGKDQD